MDFVCSECQQTSPDSSHCIHCPAPVQNNNPVANPIAGSPGQALPQSGSASQNTPQQLNPSGGAQAGNAAQQNQGNKKKKVENKPGIKKSDLEQFNLKSDKNIFAKNLNRIQGNEKKIEDKTVVQHSTVGQITAVQGNDAIIANNLTVVHGTAEEIESWSFIQFTTELYEKKYQDIPEFFSEELAIKSNALKQDRLVLLSCIDHKIAQAAAFAIIEEIGIEDKHRRLLNFERVGKQNTDLGIYLLLKKKVEVESQTVIVVDALSDMAQKFLDSLFNATVNGCGDIKRDLKSNDLLLICLVDAEKIGSRFNGKNQEFHFSLWGLPFLPHLLRRHYPDQYVYLGEQIQRQRQQGKWSKDEREFCGQVNTCIKNGALLNVIEQGGVSGAPIQNDPVFNDEKPIHNTVLYAATFFPNLNPNQFNRLVSVLLGNQTMTITVPVNQKAEDGTVKAVEIQKERSLIQIWKESSDKISRECRLIASKDSKTMIFSDIGRRDGLKSYLEEEYSLYIQNKFTSVQDSGLLFDSSKSIAKNVINLIVDMALSYPDYYGKEWLPEVIRIIRDYFAFDEAAVSHSREPIIQLINKSGGLRTEAQVYERISELIREMLTYPQLAEVISALMSQLLVTNLHDTALKIIRHLRFAPNFDEFYWMSRLLNQGDEEIRIQTYDYLYGEVKKMGRNIYQIMGMIQKWLPASDCDPQKYSFWNRFALRLMIEYCLETTYRYDPKNYGVWPCRYPLFAAEDANAAASDFDLLTRWLFHPGMKYITDGKDFDENLNQLLPALISIWMFILLGQPVQDAAESGFVVSGNYNMLYSEPGEDDVTGSQASASSNPDFTASTVMNMFLGQIIEKTDQTNQKHIQHIMILYWEQMSDLIMFALDDLEYADRNQRKELIWKRNLIRKLLVNFRRLQRQPKTF